MLNDCVALLRRSDSWTVQDETAWQDWMRDWLGWLTQPSSEHAPSFGYLEAFLPNRGNHATWMWVHTLAMAKAAGWQRLALEWLRQVRSGFPSALVNQIQASGKMATARPEGGTVTHERALGAAPTREKQSVAWRSALLESVKPPHVAASELAPYCRRGASAPLAAAAAFSTCTRSGEMTLCRT